MTNAVQLSFIHLVLFATVFTSGGCNEEIKTLTINNNGHGKYSFEFETSGGTYRREEGGVSASNGGEFLVVRGEFGYIDTRGILYSLRYVADVNGFQPEPSNYNIRYNDRRII